MDDTEQTLQEIILANFPTQGQVGSNFSILMDNILYLIDKNNVQQAITMLGFSRQFGLLTVNSLPIVSLRNN